ncbi:MAG: FAD-binding oxidoreductase [Thermomicrobiales bacterium]
MSRNHPAAASADVVVIGGGVEGSSIAYQLAKRGLDVVLLEARELASAASGASAGGVRQQGRDPRELPIAMRAIAMWPDLSEELGADIDYHQDGHLTLVEFETDLPALEERARQQKAAGLGIEMLYGDDVRQVAPGVGEQVIAGAFCPTDGHANPIWTTKAFGAAAKRLGVTVLEWTPATGILTDSGRVTGVETPDGTIGTDWVVNAAGAWSPEISKMVGLEIPIHTRAPQMLLTTEMPMDLYPVIGCVSKLLSLKQLKNGRYLIGGGWPASVYQDIAAPIGRNRHDSITGSASHSSAIWPNLLQTKVLRVWAGLEAETDDVVPILGPVDHVQGFIMASGFSGHGFALSPYIGVLIADYIATGETEIPMDELLLDRFDRPGAEPRIEPLPT